MKRCSCCGAEKNGSDFSRDRGAADGLYQACRDCQAERVRASKYRRFGYKRGDYGKMLASQGGKCAICHRDESDSRRSLHVDHCHETGHIRGLLCGRCNTAIGLFEHSPRGLRRAADYIVHSLLRHIYGELELSDKTSMAEQLDALLLAALKQYNESGDLETVNAALVRIARDRVRDLKVSVNGSVDTPAKRLIEEAGLRLAGRDLPPLDTEGRDAAVG